MLKKINRHNDALLCQSPLHPFSMEDRGLWIWPTWAYSTPFHRAPTVEDANSQCVEVQP